MLPQPRNQSGIIKLAARQYDVGMTFSTWDLKCCGLGTLMGFGALVVPDEFAAKAEFVATCYRTLYKPGHVLYSLADGRGMGHDTTNTKHLALVEIGSTKIAEFPNLFHGPGVVSLWLVNIRNAVGKFCNDVGEAYLEPSTEPWEIKPAARLDVNSPWAEFPTRKNT